MGRYLNALGYSPEEEERMHRQACQVYDNNIARNSAQISQQNANPVNNQSSQPSMMDKAVYGSNAALQGLSFGFADELEGVASGLGYGLGSLVPRWNKTGESFSDAFKRGYTQTRDLRRQQLQEGYEKAPFITHGMETIGAVVSPLNKIGQISEFAPRSAQLTNGVKKAIGGGAAYGLGAGEGDIADHSKNIAYSTAGGFMGNKFANWAKPVTSALFMNKTARGLANSAVENVAGNTYLSGAKNLEEYLRQRYGF